MDAEMHHLSEEKEEKMDQEEYLTPPATDFESDSLDNSVIRLSTVGENASRILIRSQRRRQSKGGPDGHAGEAEGSVEKLRMEDIKLEGLVALGSFGALYHGSCAGTKVAVKQLRSKWVQNKHAQQDFRKEIIMLSRLNHPNVVMFIGSVESQGDDIPMQVVLEWVSGGNLYDAIHKKKRIKTGDAGIAEVEETGETPRELQPSERFHFMNDIALGMEYLHSHSPCIICLLYTSPSPRDATLSRMPSSA